MPAALQYVVIVIALLGFWAIIIRPTRRSQQRVAQLQQEIGVGDEVIISAGIFGTVIDMDEETVHLEIAPQTVITVARQVVVRRAPEPAAPEEPSSED
ncbi:preprotein translocase subunit YajC [Marmoricola sp. RAF53]|uniref:preprotein translocase subunit YajC n=1 Tax=Marmoricola sp. RAF53 TaxID=3233059 RepID=UPI003F9C6081